MQWWDANRVPVKRFCWIGNLVASFLYSGCWRVKAALLSSEPNRHGFRITADTRTDPERWDSILFGELINVDPRNGEKGGQLCSGQRVVGAPACTGTSLEVCSHQEH